MFTIRCRTREFPTDPEGDLVLCNGQPGSALAGWLRSALADRGIGAGEPLQEDYGWGFWLDHPTAVWVAVSYAGDDQGDAADTPVWHISVEHQAPLFAPRQWFQRRQGRELASQVFEIVRAVVAQRPGMVIEEIGDA